MVIDVLGDGVVTSVNDSSLSCDSHGEFNYTEGKSLNLTASAAPGASFSHWTGCDRVSGVVCTVTIQGDRHVSPSFAKPVVYQNGVVRLDATAMAQLLAQTETSLTFSSDIKNYASFTVGDVLFSSVVTEVAEGLLRKVLSVEESNGQLIVTTEPAMIEDVIQEGTLVSSTILSPENTTVASLARGVSVSRMATISNGFKFTLNQVLIDDDGDPKTTDDQLVLTGTIEAENKLDADIDIGLTGVKTAKVIMESTLSDKLTATMSGPIGKKGSSQ